MGWSFKLCTAPQEVFSSTLGPFVVDARHALPRSTVDEAPNAMVEVDIGTDFPFIPEIAGLGVGGVLIPHANGPARYVRNQRELMTLKIAVDGWTGTQWQQFMKAVNTGKLLAFTPSWGPDTWWAWSCNGFDTPEDLTNTNDTFLAADVGKLARIIGPGRTCAIPGKYAPDDALEVTPTGNLDATITGVTGPVLTKGRLGHAFLSLSNVTERANTLTGSWSDYIGTNAISLQPPGVVQGYDVTQAGRTWWVRLQATGGGAIEYTSVTMPGTSTHHGLAFIKGTGTVRAGMNDGASVEVGGDVVLDPTKWIPVGVKASSPASATAQFFIQNRGSQPALFSITVPHMEYDVDDIVPALFRADVADATNSPSMAIDDEFTGPGLTFIWYFKAQNRNDLTYLASWQDGGSDRYIRINGITQIEFNLDGVNRNEPMPTQLLVAGTPSPLNSLAGGSWVQLALTVEPGPDTNKTTYRLYFNGGAQSSSWILNSSSLPRGDSTIHFLCDRGLGSPSGLGFNRPVDSIRVDARTWTAQELADEYDLKNTEGLRDLLAITQGRLFQVTSMPAGFRGGFLDDVVGDVTLRQVSHIPSGLMK